MFLAYFSELLSADPATGPALGLNDVVLAADSAAGPRKTLVELGLSALVSLLVLGHSPS